MSVYLTRHSGALVAIVRSSAQHDPLPDLTTMLENLVRDCDRIMLDLSEVTLGSPARLAAFLAEVESHQHDSGAEIILIADRQSSRRLLRAMAADEVAVLSSVEEAGRGRRGARDVVAPVVAGWYEGDQRGSA